MLKNQGLCYQVVIFQGRHYGTTLGWAVKHWLVRQIIELQGTFSHQAGPVMNTGPA
jgi:hypothetical protein